MIPNTIQNLFSELQMFSTLSNIKQLVGLSVGRWSKSKPFVYLIVYEVWYPNNPNLDYGDTRLKSEPTISKTTHQVFISCSDGFDLVKHRTYLPYQIHLWYVSSNFVEIYGKELACQKIGFGLNLLDLNMIH